jgi:hypothetical protein
MSFIWEALVAQRSDGAFDLQCGWETTANCPGNAKWKNV